MTPIMSDRDPHSFAADDPPILTPRKLLAECLERVEMARDNVTHATGKRDDWAERIIAELVVLLS
jgi:hypothetical protein